MKSEIYWTRAEAGLPEGEGAFLYATRNGKIGVRVGVIDEWFVMKYGVVAWAFQPDMGFLLK